MNKKCKCWQDRSKDSLRCTILVSKKLPYCEHYQDTYCSDSVDNVKFKSQVPDMIINSTFSEVDWERLILIIEDTKLPLIKSLRSRRFKFISS
ncbi:unnamed protein product [Rhizophagus irregularis]|nr:unnamed protein product [Rhizophagus irregularis]